MKCRKQVRLLLIALTSFNMLALTTQGIPPIIPYQGRLLSGTNLFQGITNVTFRLYWAPTGGIARYAETDSITVVDGLYSTFIGDNPSAGTLTNALTADSVYLQVEIGPTVLEPRERVGAVAYALMAAGVTNSAINSGMLADGAVTPQKLSSGYWSTEGNTVSGSAGHIGTLNSAALNFLAGGLSNMVLSTAGALAAAGRIQAGSVTAAASYNRMGTGASGHGLNDAADLMVSDSLEVDGGVYFDNLLHVAGGLYADNGVLYLGVTDPANNDTIYFDDGSRDLRWNDSRQQFEFDDDLVLSGVLQSGASVLADWYNRMGAKTTSHSLNTNSDLLVSGRLEVEGQIYADGGISTRSNLNADADVIVGTDVTVGDDVAMAGALQVGSTGALGVAYSRLGTATSSHALGGASNLLVSGSLEVDGPAYMDGQLYVGTATSGDDDTIWFDDGSRRFTWDDSQNEFELSDALAVAGVLQGGSVGAVAAYNRMGTNATTHSLNGGGDLLVSDALEVGGMLYGNSDVLVADDIALGGVLQAGSFVPAVAYNRLGTSATTHDLNGSNDLLVCDALEVDGHVYADASAVVKSNVAMGGVFQAGSTNITMTYNRLGGDNSGHGLNDDEDLLVSDVLEVNGTGYFDGTLHAVSDIHVGTALGTDDDQIYFDDGSRFLMWDESEGRFRFSDTLTVGGILRANGNIQADADVIVTDDVALGGVLQAGSTNPTVAYNRLGTSTTDHNLDGLGDLLVSDDLEVNGTLFADTDTIVGDDVALGGVLQAGSTNPAVGYNRLGLDPTDHGLNDAEDLLVTDMLEVNGRAYFDEKVVLADRLYVGTNSGSANGYIYMGDNGQFLCWNPIESRFRFSADLYVAGTLSKAGGSFVIDHPLDLANKYLRHSFVESPDMKNIYDGVAVLDEAGAAWVTLPDWFEALNKDFRYQLTAIGASAPNLYIAREVADNRFQIAGGVPGMKVSWQVTGTRQDAWANDHRIQVEEEKPAAARGTYLYSGGSSQPASTP